MGYGEHRTYEVVSRVNKERAIEWHGPNGLQDWSPAEWGNALAGECGELCNILKKILRHDNDIKQMAVSSSREELVAMAGKEIADVYLYLDLVCAVLELDMYDCIRDKFNEVSDREDLPQRLGL